MNGDYVISTDKTKLEIAVIHDFLSNRSYWGKGRTVEKVQKTIDNSLCFGAYDKENRLVGFARVVSDLTIVAYLMDVFILEEHRSQGLGKQLIGHIVNHPALQDIRFWRLDTDDAHELYRKYGFKEPAFPEKIMEKRNTANEAVQRIGHKTASR
jgi:GNAT superfamily N-acetyltransferase